MAAIWSEGGGDVVGYEGWGIVEGLDVAAEAGVAVDYT